MYKTIASPFGMHSALMIITLPIANKQYIIDCRWDCDVGPFNLNLPGDQTVFFEEKKSNATAKITF